MISEQVLRDIYTRHFQTVWNVCYPYFQNRIDTEDAVQDTFVHLMHTGIEFRDEQHEKAWLIVTARNLCRDELRRARRRDLPLEEAGRLTADEPVPDDTMRALAALPDKYRTVIYLYYYEGFPTGKIARILHLPDSTVRSHLKRGRDILKKQLGGL